MQKKDAKKAGGVYLVCIQGVCFFGKFENFRGCLINNEILKKNRKKGLFIVKLLVINYQE